LPTCSKDVRAYQTRDLWKHTTRGAISPENLERFVAASLCSRHKMAAGLWKTLSSDNSTCPPRR